MKKATEKSVAFSNCKQIMNCNIFPISGIAICTPLAYNNNRNQEITKFPKKEVFDDGS